jgi:DNA-binding NarL/FixJ family response regulator
MFTIGLTDKEIGGAVKTSENTVRKHVISNIEKLDASDRIVYPLSQNACGIPGPSS